MSSKSIYWIIPVIFINLAHGQESVKVTSDFTGGNIVVDNIDKDTVWLNPDLSHTDGPWFYWYFKASNINGKTITFKFNHENVFAKYGPGYSINNDQDWKWYGEHRIQGNSFTYSFSEQDSIAYFSMAFPYTQGDFNTFLSALRNHRSLIIDSLCQSPEGRLIEKVILPSNADSPRFKVLITARHHACEMMASYVLEGIIESILNDRNLSYLRDHVEFLIIPFMDKDGVEHGEQGKNRIPRDHNRDYIGESSHNSTATLRKLIPEWSEEKLKIALDLHCPWIYGKPNEDIYLVGSSDPEMEKNQITFSKMLEKNAVGDLRLFHRNFIPFGTSWNTSDNYSKGKSFSRWAGSLNGISLAGTIEFPYANVSGVPVSKDGARRFGKAIAISMNEYLESLK